MKFIHILETQQERQQNKQRSDRHDIAFKEEMTL